MFCISVYDKWVERNYKVIYLWETDINNNSYKKY
jgi:hypothetical protein